MAAHTAAAFLVYGAGIFASVRRWLYKLVNHTDGVAFSGFDYLYICDIPGDTALYKNGDSVNLRNTVTEIVYVNNLGTVDLVFFKH